MNKVTVYILLVVGLLLAGCTGGFEAYESEALKITAEKPAEWYAEETEVSVSFATEQSIMEAETLANGAVLTVSVGSPEQFGTDADPLAMVQVFLEFFAGDSLSSLEFIKEPVELTIQGNPAALVSMRGTVQDEFGTLIMAVIRKGDRIAVVLGVDGTPNSDHFENLEKITESISLGE